LLFKERYKVYGRRRMRRGGVKKEDSKQIGKEKQEQGAAGGVKKREGGRWEIERGNVAGPRLQVLQGKRL
jgi:hypothetical protein